jgi:hypothetical protein
MSRWSPAFLSVLLSALAFAQDVPPPPKPADEGPSLKVTMKFIQDKLNGHGEVNSVLTVSNSRNNSDVSTSISLTMSGADANPASCALSVTETWAQPGLRQDRRIEFSFQEVEKLFVSSWADANNRRSAEGGNPGFTEEFAPSVFSLTVVMQEGKLLRVHIHESDEGRQADDSDLSPSPKREDLIFREEETAQRVAKAMVHAVELCGGGNKEPF